MIRNAYRTLLENKLLSPDPEQIRVIDALQDLYDELLAQPARKGLLSRFSKTKPIQGLYIYGGVGRGKSMLMDLFYAQLPAHIHKRRVHFHAFMSETHAALHRLRESGKDDILPLYAKSVAADIRVMCFDEFHVSDIADAMILGRLFQALFDEGLVIVTTSNRPPDDLYKGGLQRDRFLPFVDLLKRRMRVLHLDSDTDYRMRAEEDDLSRRYVTPLGELSRNWANRVFLKLSNGAPIMPETLNIKGRQITIDASAGGVSRLSFAQLCERPVGTEDYLAIAARFPTIILEGVPKMNYDRRNEAKRFMSLIDILYDKGTDVYITAETAPEHLYVGTDHAFEFERTVSRLNEMSRKEG